VPAVAAVEVPSATPLATLRGHVWTRLIDRLLAIIRPVF